MTGRSDTAPAGVLVFSEKGDVANELLAVARPLADAVAARVTMLLAGAGLRERAQDCIARGADEALLVTTDGTSLGGDGYLEALHAAVRASRPALILVGSTRTGIEVAARLGQRLRVGCITDALTLQLDGDGAFSATRRAYGGRFVATVILRSSPAIATVPPLRFEAPPPDSGRSGSVTELPIALPPPRLRTVATEARPRSAGDLRKAAVVVAVGRGLKRREDLALVEALRAALGAALAGTRPITDDLRWLAPDRKIGLSGQTVRPALYVACGISGQIEHVVGMRAARTVVAINSDPAAPIHAEADYSIVGDLYALVPALADAVREVRTRQGTALQGGPG